MIRNALVPAAGRGLRLDRPRTPKPLVDVGGKPMIIRLIEQFEQRGINRTTVVIGYEGERVARAIKAHFGLRSQMEIIVNPRWEEGLARSILLAQPLFEGPFLLAMADHVFDDELVDIMIAEQPQNDGLVALVDDDLDRDYDRNMAVKVRLEGSSITAIGRNLNPYDAVDAGMFVAEKALFDYLAKVVRSRKEADLSDAVAEMAALGKVKAAVVDGHHFTDVDTPRDLVQAEMRLRRKQRAQKTQVVRRVEKAPHCDVNLITVAPPEPARIIVGRGFVREPEKLDIIPESSSSSPVFVFVDDTVNRLYGEMLVARLKGFGYDIHAIVLPDGEEAKTLANYAYVVERVLSRGVDERSIFISLGGGVVCNVCGFVASTIYRGLGLVHLPTTVMAQCDAAISHKQAINGYQGKNMVGSYYLPRLVAADVETLSTLPLRLKRDGLAEGLKHGLGQDRAYAEWFLGFEGDPSDLDFLETVVRRNVALKCELAADDPKENRQGMVLQYGHTVGHAVEHLSGYQLYHGESVAIGMVVAARVSRILGACSDEIVDVHEEICRRYDLPVHVPQNIATQDIIDSLRYNKRYLVEGTRMALLSGLGELWSVDGDFAIPVSDRVLAEAIDLSRERIRNG